jgi:outer membrane biosynthesis protein TonB
MPTHSPQASEAGIHGTVQFLFANGVIKNPKITVSTGDPGLDQLMLEQVASAKVPMPRGPHAEEPHEFELPLDMFTPFEALQYAIYAAIDYKKIYSRNALISRSTGLTTLEFDYVHSAARNIVITKSSGNRELDKLSINTVSRAELPAAPADYAGKTVHMKVIFCYNINNAPACPVANNVIAVRGVIFRRGY